MEKSDCYTGLKYFLRLLCDDRMRLALIQLYWLTGRKTPSY